MSPPAGAPVAMGHSTVDRSPSNSGSFKMFGFCPHGFFSLLWIPNQSVIFFSCAHCAGVKIFLSLNYFVSHITQHMNNRLAVLEAMANKTIKTTKIKLQETK